MVSPADHLAPAASQRRRAVVSGDASTSVGEPVVGDRAHARRAPESLRRAPRGGWRAREVTVEAGARDAPHIERAVVGRPQNQPTHPYTLGRREATQGSYAVLSGELLLLFAGCGPWNEGRGLPSGEVPSGVTAIPKAGTPMQFTSLGVRENEVR